MLTIYTISDAYGTGVIASNLHGTYEIFFFFSNFSKYSLMKQIMKHQAPNMENNMTTFF